MQNADGLRKQNLVTKAIEHMHGMAILEVTTQAPLLYQFKYICVQVWVPVHVYENQKSFTEVKDVKD